MKIAICDDQTADLEKISNLLKKELLGTAYSDSDISLYSDGRKLIRENVYEAYDLIILDIEMPGINGEEIAEYFNRESEDTILAFASYHDEMVFKTLHTYPTAFIRKINLEDDLRQAIPHIMEKYEEKRKTVTIETEAGPVVLNLSRIWYFESGNRKIVVHLSNDRFFTIKYSIRSLSKELEPYGFYRIHQSYLVNRNYINHIETGSVYMTGKKIILPLSKYREKQVRNVFMKYLLR